MPGVRLLPLKRDNRVMKATLDLVTKVKELLRRASNVLANLESVEESDNVAMEAAYWLLKAYVTGHEVAAKSPHYESWLVATRGSGFFHGCLNRAIQQATVVRDQIEDGASTSERYAVALDILRDYETHCSERAEQKAAIDAHTKEQRIIITSKRKEFFTALEKRHGLFCRACGSVEDLVIDHIVPLCDGGFSELENLQLLCRFCNGSKGFRDMDYLERMNQRRKRAVN
jgi:5-methylcytosine-specific restriction endonuclease McrA